MNMTVRILAVLLVVGYLGFSAFADPSSKKIKQSEFGKSWPFTVKEGVLACEGSNGFGAVTFTAKGVTYAINGVASGTKKYQDLKKIWKSDGNLGLKVSVGPIIEMGLKLCK